VFCSWERRAEQTFATYPNYIPEDERNPSHKFGDLRDAVVELQDHRLLLEHHLKDINDVLSRDGPLVEPRVFLD
jgi:hypothetical protein